MFNLTDDLQEKADRVNEVIKEFKIQMSIVSIEEILDKIDDLNHWRCTTNIVTQNLESILTVLSNRLVEINARLEAVEKSIKSFEDIERIKHV